MLSPESKICTISIGLVVIALIISSCSTTDVERPNILWIVSEDNSPLLGAYGDSLATTPNLDRLAGQGIVYTHAYATTPVCAPSRFTLITGMYANVMGTENMRSTFPIPEFIRFFPTYLRQAGYHTTNNAKKDYNTVDQPEAWGESSSRGHYRNRAEGQLFFHVKNLATTHESHLHDPIDTLRRDPDRCPFHPTIRTSLRSEKTGPITTIRSQKWTPGRERFWMSLSVQGKRITPSCFTTATMEVHCPASSVICLSQA